MMVFMANRRSFTNEKKKLFLKALCESGIVSHACRVVGITNQAAYDNKGKDEPFSLAWDDAVEEAIDELEIEARRRAIQGVTEHVFYQGDIVGSKQNYSDNLMMFLMKGKRPGEFGGGVGDGGPPEQEVEGFDFEDVSK